MFTIREWDIEHAELGKHTAAILAERDDVDDPGETVIVIDGIRLTDSQAAIVHNIVARIVDGTA